MSFEGLSCSRSCIDKGFSFPETSLYLILQELLSKATGEAAKAQIDLNRACSHFSKGSELALHS